MEMLSIEKELQSNSYPGRSSESLPTEAKRSQLILSWEEVRTAVIVSL